MQPRLGGFKIVAQAFALAQSYLVNAARKRSISKAISFLFAFTSGVICNASCSALLFCKRFRSFQGSLPERKLELVHACWHSSSFFRYYCVWKHIVL